MVDPSLMHGVDADGHEWVRCCICGELHVWPHPNLYVDDDGAKWDLCEGRCAEEAGERRKKDVMDDTLNGLLETTDGSVWAEEFCKRWTLTTVDGAVVDDAEGLMIAWFANAIETGRGAGLRMRTP